MLNTKHRNKTAHTGLNTQEQDNPQEKEHYMGNARNLRPLYGLSQEPNPSLRQEEHGHNKRNHLLQTSLHGQDKTDMTG